MSGNTFGNIFTLTSFGESHGAAIGGVVDGCPAGLTLNIEDIQTKLDRRRPGQNRFVTQRQETDQVEVLSGVFAGKTTGTPIGLLIRNVDAKSGDYSEIAQKFRPGHADFTYHKKYGIRDYRGGGRASARETAVRVAGGAIAQKYLLEKFNINICAYLTEIGGIKIPFISYDEINQSDFFAANLSMSTQIAELIDKTRKAQDAIGGIVEVVAKNVPIGLGEPVYQKLDAAIAGAMMGINAVKGVEIGAGFESAKQLASVHNDQMNKNGFLSNNAGGILGGISNGNDIVVRLAIKPTPSIYSEQKTINVYGEETTIATKGRHDPCVAIRAVPVVEAMLALVLIDFILIQNFHNK